MSFHGADHDATSLLSEFQSDGHAASRAIPLSRSDSMRETSRHMMTTAEKWKVPKEMQNVWSAQSHFLYCRVMQPE